MTVDEYTTLAHHGPSTDLTELPDILSVDDLVRISHAHDADAVATVTQQQKAWIYANLQKCVLPPEQDHKLTMAAVRSESPRGSLRFARLTINVRKERRHDE